jgi:hypothetical protein
MHRGVFRVQGSTPVCREVPQSTGVREVHRGVLRVHRSSKLGTSAGKYPSLPGSIPVCREVHQFAGKYTRSVAVAVAMAVAMAA